MKAFVSYHLSGKPSLEVRAWAKVSNDGMKVTIGRQLAVHLRPRFTNVAVYPNCQVGFLETNPLTFTPDLLGGDRFVCIRSSTTESEFEAI